MEKVLVAGGAGFLGSWMCDRAIDEGCSVICLDNLYTGSLSNVEHLEENENFRFFAHDIRFPLPELDENDRSLFDGVTHVMNFACPASPPAYQKDPLYTLETCFDGTKNLANFALARGATFFQASTSEVYGDPLVVPQCENYLGNVNTIGPRACYDEGKRVAETLLFDMKNRHGLDVKVARIFNTYGPRMNPSDGRVVSNFICQALRGEPLTVHGDGRQTRAFCFVDDMVEGIWRLTFKSRSDFSGPVNLGSSDEMEVVQLIGHLKEILGTRLDVAHETRPVDDPERRRPDTTLAMLELGWAVNVPTLEGLQRTVNYFSSVLGLSLSNQLDTQIAL